MEAAFSLGANLGDRLATLSEAKARILAEPGVTLAAASPAYETEPVGVKPEYQDLPYINAVLVVQGPYAAEAWMERIARIERGLGRERSEDRYAPRTIDIDLLYCGDELIDTGGVQVPHPRWAKRRFVVQPLADVRPERVLPGAGRTVREVLDNLPPGEHVDVIARDW